MEEINGCLGVGEKVTDYRLTEGLLDALPTLYQQDEVIFQYNQYNQKRSQKSCTLFSPIGAISDLMNIEIPLDTIKVWDKGSYSHGRKEGEGWWSQLGVDYICDCYNASQFAKDNGKVAYYSVDIKDNELVKKILDKRYTICVCFQGSSKYTNDKNDNGVLDGTEFGPYTYGHAVNVIRGINSPSRIKDNYYGIKHNIYDVAHQFSQLSNFYDRGYVITKVREDKLEDLKRLNEMNTTVVILIENNSKLRHLTNDDNLKNELHKQNNLLRAKQKDIENEIKKCM